MPTRSHVRRARLRTYYGLRMQVGVPCGGSLQLLKTVAVQCGNCFGILSVALPPPEVASVELPLQVPAVRSFPLHYAAHWPNDVSNGTGDRR